MNLEKIRELVEKDMVVDNTELATESTKIPQLHNKYLNIFHDERLVLRKQEMNHKVLNRQKWEYYTGKMSQEQLEEFGWPPFQTRVMRQDVPLYIGADLELIESESKIALQQEKVDYLESVLKLIMQRHWMLRNAIEWRKFTQGVT